MRKYISAVKSTTLSFAATLLKPPKPVSNIGEGLGLMCTLANWAYTVALLLSIVFVLVAAFKYMTSGGDPEKTKSAKNTIFYAAIGIAIAIIAKGVPLIVSSIVGAESVSDVCATGNAK